MKGFKEFVTRGNVVQLAIAVVVGIAFGTLISSFVKNLLTPLVSIPGKADFASLKFTVHGSTFHYGVFVNDVISFVIIMAAIYFVVVLPMNRLAARRAATTKECTDCLTEIPVAARKCSACGSVQEPAVVPAPTSGD